MIPETLVMWTALGANAILAAKLFAFRLQPFDRLPELPPRLPDRKSTETIAKSEPSAIKNDVQLPPRLPHFRQPELACVTLPKAIDLLIDWCNGQGLVGVHSSSEIETYWKTACVELDLEPIDVRFIREALDGRGLRLGQKRLNTPEYIAIRQRTGKDRLVLYRIPRSRAVAAPVPEEPATTPGHPAADRLRPGTRAAIAEKPNPIRRAA